jgi:drug/metabolite transporter (DMT)-like permease
MFAAAFGFLLLDELITVMQAGGIILLAVGVYLVSKREEARL